MNSFRGLLLEISNDLTTSELQDLKFACSDFIPAGRAEHITRTHALFSELERMNLLGENNRDFLASVFVRIGRSDLRNKLLGIKETPTVVIPQRPPGEMSLETTIVSDSIINDIAEDVSTSWRMVGRKLGVKETIIDNIDDEYRKVADKATKVLYKWKKNNVNKATVAALMTGLRKAGRTDLAEEVRDKVLAEGFTPRPANENQDNPAQAVLPPQPFPNMADLNPARHGIQEQQKHHLPRGEMRPNDQPVGENREHHDAPLGDDQQVAVNTDEAPIREEIALVENEQPGSDSTDTTRTPVQAEETAEKHNDSSTVTSRIPVQPEDMKSPPVTLGNYLNPAKYAVAELIGVGGFSEVYLCYDKKTGAKYAAKLVNLKENDSKIQKQVAALRKEIDILKKLDSPYIVRYCYTEEEYNTLVLFMEYMEGGSVKKLLCKGPMAQHLVRKLTWYILQGVKYLHGEKVTHRDIKGANVLVDGNNNAKLADFGISKDIEMVITGTTMVTDKEFIGSGYWTSPELLQGKEYHRNTDCWSVGCTVIEMLTGNPPLAHLGMLSAMMHISMNGLSPPKSCTSLASEFLTKCLTVDTSKRPSATELLDDPFPTLTPDE